MTVKSLHILSFILLSSLVLPSYSQVYVEKQTRHRFAQLNMGLDLQTSFGGSTKYFDANGTIESMALPGQFAPRFLIGGTHFWGHADFYIGIPLYSPSTGENNQEIVSFRGVETVFKYYPYRIENNKLRPYIGTSLAPFYFQQTNDNLEYSSGPEVDYIAFPLMAGLTFNSKQHLFEIGIAWNYKNKRDYYISRDQVESIDTPPLYATLSYRFMLETTLSAEPGWESGQTQEVTANLASKKKLNGLYLGVGISSATWLKESSYNTENRPYVEDYGTSIMADFSMGYYLHNPDINLAIAYRGYGTSTDSYGAVQNLKRKSILFEATKYLFDYHGFAPFIGPAVSYEFLTFNEIFEGTETVDIGENRVGYALTFGWDIRPNKIQSWLLRTNLRWYPNLYLEVEPNSLVSFDNLEFNFIQLIVFPSRLKESWDR